MGESMALRTSVAPFSCHGVHPSRPMAHTIEITGGKRC